jgi:hypothetical protein
MRVFLRFFGFFRYFWGFLGVFDPPPKTPVFTDNAVVMAGGGGYLEYTVTSNEQIRI